MPHDSPQRPVIGYLSTNEVPRAHRLEYWSSVLSGALIPMTLTTDDPTNFSAAVTTTSLGPLRVTRTQGGAHASRRTLRDVERSEDRCFHLLVSLDSPWKLTHRGRSQLQRGDLILNDSRFEHEIDIRTRYDILNFRLPVEWLSTWIPDPDILVGRRIPAQSQWGSVLSPAAMRLRPDLLVMAPLPGSLLADQLGAMLAVVAGAYEKASAADWPLLKRIDNQIRQRCAEPGLTANEVAACLSIEPQVLHRALATVRHTFAARLLDARVELAVRLLRSANEGNVQLTEIARRAGFVRLLQLDRAIKRRLGHCVRDLQRAPQPSTRADSARGE